MANTELKTKILDHVTEHRVFEFTIPIEATHFKDHSWHEVLAACDDLQRSGFLSYELPQQRLSYIRPTDKPGFNGAERVLLNGNEKVVLVTPKKLDSPDG
ncbi:hypothetical protein [Halomonas caseinilytica]|uniref:Uncharacterized protein n=1 Tax=Halomonas caseinilytica TaxID=438744 RepID=A0A1M6RZT8_9GAMM|nr:hypothetical protein [Halomonas caseinilytica]SHK37829.1 hypothetical protein SAMN05192556_102453 [Halomonas caseinilytica]